MKEYHTLYTLDYIAENQISIKPKDEEEAKQLINYLYAMGYQWISDTQQDTFYHYYKNKTSYFISPSSVITFSTCEKTGYKYITPQQISGKDEENQLVCSFKKFVEEQLQIQTETNKIKEETNMLELVKLYKERKMGKIARYVDNARATAWERDSTYKTLKDLAEKTKKKNGYLFTFNFEIVPDLVAKELDRLNREKEEKEIELNKLIEEVNAQLDLCETYDQKIVILKGYGILDWYGKISV